MTPGTPIGLIVRYSCLCGLDRVSVAVPFREPGEDIKKWMEMVTLALQHDHAKRKPVCTARSLKEVMIPINKDANMRVGEEIKP